MLELEVRNKMINKLSAALVPELGLPVDIIERSLKKAFKKISEENNDNNAFDNSSFPSPTTPSTPSTPTLPTNIHNDMQVLKPVNELSQGSTFNPSDPNHNFYFDDDLKTNKNQQESSSQTLQRNRKDSYSSLIEITQSGSKSINIKLPNIYATQEDSNNQIIKPTNSINENSSRPGSISYPDKNNVYNNNNNNMMQNRQMDSIHNDLNSTEYIPSQQRESYFDTPTNQVQNTNKSHIPEVQNRQIDSENISRRKDSQDTYNYISESDQRQQGESNVNQIEEFEFDPVPPRSSDYINNEPSDPYRSDSDNSYIYNSQIHTSHTSHQQPNSNQQNSYVSEWPTISEVIKKSDSRRSTEVDLGAWGQIGASAWGKPKKWLSETETRKPEPKPVNAWNPNDVDHSWSPIPESKAPLFKKKKNAPVHFEFDDNEGWGAPPTKYTPWEDDEKQGYCFDLIQEQKQTVFWTKQNDVWVNVSEEVKITQVERSSNGANQRDVRQTRTQTQRIERQGSGREQIEVENENIVIELTDDETNSNSAKSTRERLGNPQWKTEKEWLSHNNESGEEHSTSDKDENEPTSNWDYFPQTTEESVDTVKDDTWSSEDNDIMSNEQEDTINEPEQDLLINVDPNSENMTSESTIINTHPPIYHGTISNTMTDSNDIILDYTNSANTTSNMNITNNSELNLLLFEDEEDINKVSNSSDNLTSIESQPQENDHTYNIEELEAYLENNRAIHNGVNGDNKHEVELTNHSNELQSADTDNYESSRYVPSLNSPTDTSPSKSYYFDDPPQSNIEPITSSALDVEGRDEERAPYITNGYESSRYVPSLNSPADTSSYYYEDSPQPNIEPTTFDDKGRDDERKGSNNDKSNSTKDYMINITVETPSDGRQILRLRLDDDPQAKTAEFCKKWGMTNYEDALEGLVQKEKRKRLRKRKNKWCVYNGK